MWSRTPDSIMILSPPELSLVPLLDKGCVSPLIAPVIAFKISTSRTSDELHGHFLPNRSRLGARASLSL